MKSLPVSREGGFTLVELLITLTLGAIIAGWAVPSLKAIADDYRIASASNSFERFLRQSRREALIRRETIRLCPSANGVTCGGTDWSSGWISYADLEGGPERNAGDPLIRVRAALPRLSIRDNAAASLGINRSGRLIRNGSVVFCSLRGDHPGRRLTFIHSGRLRTSVPAGGCNA